MAPIPTTAPSASAPKSDTPRMDFTVVQSGDARAAMDHLLATMEHRTVASFEVDELLDYRSRRPPMVFVEDHWESYDDPHLVLHEVVDAAGVRFLLLEGAEPDVQWERFIAAVTATSITCYLSWVVFQACLYVFVPGRLHQAPRTPGGRRLFYRLNGHGAWALTVALAVGVSYAGLVDPVAHPDGGEADEPVPDPPALRDGLGQVAPLPAGTGAWLTNSRTVKSEAGRAPDLLASGERRLAGRELRDGMTVVLDRHTRLRSAASTPTPSGWSPPWVPGMGWPSS